MLKQLSIIIICILSFNFSNAQKNYWSSVEYDNIRINPSEIINYDMMINHASYFQLDKVSLSTLISSAPDRNNTTNSEVYIEIPNQNGNLETYNIFKVQTLSPQLVQNYQQIQSYVGQRTDTRDGSILRLTLTPQGFYAMVLKPDVGQLFINPYDKNGQYYVSFLKNQVTDLNAFYCEFEGNDDLMGENPILPETDSFVVDDSTLRTYGLAMACTGEYAQYHINQANLGSASQAQQTSAVLAAMTVTVDRVNSVYEKDFGVSMQLIPNTDQLIFLDSATDPYNNNSSNQMINQNQTTINNIVGSTNYDIGHVFSTGGGGLAGFGVVCNFSSKARGVTGLPNPVGDPFDIDFVAHEMGHQFGASHTQNNNCQRSAPTAVEPGSGNTIMGYAGICAPNVQSNSDAHFHRVSIDQIFNYISNSLGSTCGTFSGQPNTAPTITAVPNYTIPNGTAFYLDVDAVDAENDALTYNWEQIDNDIALQQPPVPTATNGPNFRSLPSKTDSRRYFPDFNDVINNNLAPTWEVIPSVPRTINFAVTVRDNNIQVGQSSKDEVSVNFANVGPFKVTSQNNTDINWLPGETRTITWDVAGTTSNGINTSNVNILLSTDGGQNFDTVLASNATNNGSADIIVPSLQAPFCRVMVEPVDNVYYAINASEFSINSIVNITCDDYANINTVNIPDGIGTPTDPQNGQVVASTINIPDNISNIDDINVTLNVSHTRMSDLLFQLENPDGDIILLWAGNCSNEDGFNIVFNDNATSLPGQGANCENPLNGTFKPIDTSINLATIFSSTTVGDWNLVFADFISQETGSLNSWEIEICSTSFSVEDNNLNNFSIVPNPNDGIFNITFNQPLDENSKISIFDLQGRLIENLKIRTNSANQQIILQNQYQSGTYLIVVSNDDAKSVNKLIIR